VAIETFSVELEALLAKFLSSLKEAKTNLDGIGKFADKVAKDIDKSFANVKIDLMPEGVEQTSSALDKVTESATQAGTLFQRLNDNFGTIRSSIVTLGKTLEVFGDRLNIPALQNFGNIIFVLGKQLDNSSDAFEALKRAFTTGDIEGIAKSFGRFAFVIKNLGQLLSNLGKRLKRLALLGSILGKTFGLFSGRARLIGKIAPILRTVGIALDDVGKRAKKTAGFIGEVGEGLPADEAVRSTSVLRKLGRVLISLLKVGAVVAAFKGLKAIFFDIASGGKRTSVALTTLTRAAGLGVSSVAALGASVVGTTTPLGRLLTTIDKTAFATARLSGAAGTLAKGPGVRRFATVASAAMQRAEDATIRVAKAIPGVQLGFRAASGAVNKFRTFVVPAVKSVSALSNNIIGLSSGTLGLLPGVNKAVKVTKKLAIAATLATGSLGGTSAAMGFLAGASGKLLAGIAGLNLVLIGLGVALDAVGKKLLRTLRGFAERADAANLAFVRLENVLRATEAATGIALGGIEAFREQAQILSAVTGQNIVDIAKLQTVFVGLNQTLKLPIETLNEIIFATAAAGTTINDLGGSVIAVKDAFIGILRPLLLRFGATIKTEEVDRLAAEAAGVHADSLEGLGEEARKAATNLAIAELVLKALGPSASVAQQASLSLQIETGKLAAAQDLMARTIGERSIPSMALLTKTTRLVVQGFQPFIEATAFIIAPLTTFAGVALRVFGTLLKFGTIFAILSNGFAIVNRLLKINIGSFGKAGGILRRFTKSVTQQTIAVRGLGDVFKVLGAFIATGFVEGGKTLVKFGKRLTAGGVRATAFRLTIGPLTAVFKNFFAVVGPGIKILTRVIVANIKLIARSTVLLAIFGLVVAAVVKLFQKYDLLTKITEFLGRLFRRLFGDGAALGKAFTKLGQVIQLIALGAFALLEVILLVVTKAVANFAKAMLVVLKTVNFLTFGLFGLGPALITLADEIAETADAAADQLAKGLKETAGEMKDLGKEIVTGEKRIKDIGKSTKITSKEFEKMGKVVERLAVFAQIGIKGLDASIESVTASVESNLDKLQTDFDIAAGELSATTGEAAREAISGLEAQLITDVVAVQEAGLDKIREFIQARLELQKSSLPRILANDEQGAAERIQVLLDFELEAREIEAAALERTLADTKTRINDIRKREAARIAIIKSADEAIEQSRRELEDKLLELQLGTLRESEKISLLRQKTAEADSKFRAAIAAKDVKAAKEASVDREKLALRAVRLESKAEKQRAAFSKISITGTVEARRKAFKEFEKIIGSSTAAGIQGFTALKKTLDGVFDADKAKAQLAIFQDAFAAFLGQQKSLAEAPIFTIRQDQVRELNELIKTNQDIQRAADEEKLATSQSFFQRTLAQFEQIKKEIADPKLILVGADLTMFNEAIERIKKRKIIVRATVIVDRSDVSDNSIVPLEDTAQAITKTITPKENIPAVVELDRIGELRNQLTTVMGNLMGSMGGLARSMGAFTPGAMSPQLAGAMPGGAPTKIIRVDINMGGERMAPVEVVGEQDADNLVNAIKRINRTRGNFKSPFVKNG